MEIKMSKLNLGCGQDTRTNYVNIDRQPTAPDVRVGDFKNLSILGIADASCDEILAIDIIRYVPLHEFEKTVSHWASKLAPKGEIFIQSCDSQFVGNGMAFAGLSIDIINQILYSEGTVAIYSIDVVEDILQRYGILAIEKGYDEGSRTFFIRGRKQSLIRNT